MILILLVDDEPSILYGLTLGLSSRENTVECADSGESAIRKGRDRQYDVLIVDLCLPDMHGFDVFQTLKAGNPQLVSIVITAQCSRETAAEARKLGVDAYFEKPFHVNSIRDAIARGIQRRVPAQ